MLSRMVGAHNQDKIIEIKPSKRYIVGCLASRKKDSESEYQDEGKASVRARRLKVSFLYNKRVSGPNAAITVKVSGFIYYPIILSLSNKLQSSKNSENIDSKNNENEKPILSWKRQEFESEINFDESEINSTVKEIDFSNIVNEINKDKDKYVSININDWQAEIGIERNKFNLDHDIVTIYITNNSFEQSESKKDQQKEQTLFDCKLDVTLHNIIVGEFIDEYEYEGYRQKYYYDFRPINCQVCWSLPKKKFSTQHYACYYQKNILPRQSLSDLDLSFTSFISESILFKTLENFGNKLKKYALMYKKNYDDNYDHKQYYQSRNEDLQSSWDERWNLIQHYNLLSERIQEGIDEIQNNLNAKASFMKMNEVFDRYYTNKGIAKGQWRIFQLAFVLAVIPSITQKKDTDIADILHVSTGGGKSEAYFALVVFTSFYERSTGKKDGVTAIIKFPLRMLSIQQLERIASIIIYAEKVRKDNESIFPGSPFSLGYYVGDSPEFPNLYNNLRKRLYEGFRLKSPSPLSLIISSCPLCDKQNRGNVRLVEDKVRARIIHKCDYCNNEFLIVSSAREIYRIRPTVIVSTVDKWASLTLQRRGRNLLGGKGSECPKEHGFIPSGDQCEHEKKEAFQCPIIGEDVVASHGPVISIQDEMHLLKEGFGTISGHFEGLLESLIEYTSNRKLKHITMSATLNGASNQIQELYNKKSFVIPGRCPEEIGGENDLFFETKQGPKRIIFGLKPNLRDNHYASLRSVLHCAEFIFNSQIELIKNTKEFSSKYEINNSNDAQNLIKQFIIPLTYHIKKQDAYEMQKLEKEVITPEIIETNSKIGNEISIECNGTTITGDNKLEELKHIINSIENYIQEYDQNIGKNFKLMPLYATSVVSHGVDLDELNLMIFQGLPYSTSEYIQALSRVGRKNLGIVLLWFYPNRVRDDSFYRNFIRYHQTLDHQVKPVPIKRLSKLGIHQTLNSLFCGSIINYLSNIKGRPIIYKKDIEDGAIEDNIEISDFIRKCYTGKCNGILNINLAREIEDRINYIKRANASHNTFFPKILAESDYYFYRNQTGMRGIQRKLILDLDYQDQHKVKSRSKYNTTRVEEDEF